LRTLLISDLHLGARSGTAVLEQSESRAALISRLSGVDRLVLLGDLVELRQGPLQRVLGVALPVLSELAEALGTDKEVVIVPGNHDHRLLSEWRVRRPSESPLGLESVVSWRTNEPLGALAQALAPACVRASYPGVWLRPDVYAIHGHYLDRHITVPLLERLGAGVMERVRRGDERLDPSDEYEAVLAPMYDAISRVADRGLSTGLGLQTRVWRGLERGRQRRGDHRPGRFLPLAVGSLNRLGLGPLNPDLSGGELRRAGLRAFEEVLRRLTVQSEHVIFGHTHRAGPLPGDDRSEWVAAKGAKMVNSGSWVSSREFAGGRPHSSPYRAGFAVVVDDQGPPEVVNLLDPRREPAGDPPPALRPDPV
jgi:predicted phosphodiesterase